MNLEELADGYRAKSDEELLRLALNSEQLTPEANIALTDELAKRRIGDRKHLDAAREAERESKAENDRDIGTLGLVHLFGVGRLRFGRAGRSYDPSSGMERFKTTVFIVLLFFPLIPTGTYLVERKRGFLSNQMTVLERLPLNWEQVLTVWVVAGGSIVACLWAIRFLSYSETARQLFRRILR
jgi:hypothetical protein